MNPPHVRIFSAARVHSQAGAPIEAFATIEDRIVATGGREALRTQFRGAQSVDFGDAVIVPGFNDAHAHMIVAAEDVLHLDLSVAKVRSLAELKAVVRSEAQRFAGEPTRWIRGSRYDDAKMSEGRVLTRWDLDEVAPDHPVLVVHVAGHWGVVNSRALELGAVTEEGEAPAGGRWGRDAAGRLNGILFEQAVFDFAYPSLATGGKSVAPASTLEERLNGLERAQAMFHATGMTSLGDALCEPADIALLQEARIRGKLTMRVNALLAVDHYDAFRKAGIRTGFGDEHLRIGGVKALLDGAIGGRTCLLDEPFEGTDDHGMQTTSTAELRDIAMMVQEDGNRLCVHCNGDRALGILLDQFEAAAARFPRRGLRHRIEHCSVVNEEIVGRIKRLGAYPIPFAGYVAYHGGKLRDWYGEKRLERMFAHNWFLREGIVAGGSSDYPCGPYAPLYGMRSMVTRRGDDGVPLGLSQQIEAAQALAVYTLGSAEVCGDADVKGRLAPGYLADFVVLDGDPLDVDPLAIDAIEVRATYVGAREVWHAT